MKTIEDINQELQQYSYELKKTILGYRLADHSKFHRNISMWVTTDGIVTMTPTSIKLEKDSIERFKKEIDESFKVFDIISDFIQQSL